MPYEYETNGAAIYKQSFATIRAEAALDRFDKDEEQVAVRMIHAAGMVDLAQFGVDVGEHQARLRPARRSGACHAQCSGRAVEGSGKYRS